MLPAKGGTPRTAQSDGSEAVVLSSGMDLPQIATGAVGRAALVEVELAEAVFEIARRRLLKGLLLDGVSEDSRRRRGCLQWTLLSFSTASMEGERREARKVSRALPGLTRRAQEIGRAHV